MELDRLLELSVKQNASDLHLAPGLSPIMRIDGELFSVQDTPVLNAEHTQKLIYSIMSKKQQEEFSAALDIDFATEISSARFRVNAFHQMNGIAAVFRVIPDKPPTLDELDLPPIFKKLLDLPNGLILVTGPAGSGKTTTLAAMVDYMNAHQSSHIITIEDPIEFTHQSKKCLISQREIHQHTHHFASALRSALREDPDVILLGEMRDLETIRLALTAAETGHLVIATLHTSSAPRSVNRVIDVFPAAEKNIIRNLLSESLQAVICQTLVKRIDGGRVAALEMMLGTPAIRNLIRDDNIAQMITAIQTGASLGMCTLDQSLQSLLGRNCIDKQTAQKAAINKNLFQS